MPELPSEYKRLKRVAKSLIPRFNKSPNRKHYQLNDAKHMLNELGMQMSPALLKYLTEDDRNLDEFIDGIYALEDELGVPVVNEFGSVRPDLSPQVYVVTEERVIGFSVVYGGEEIVFVEYTIPSPE
ncbi:MAG: hypothetical protein MRZ79_06930 [Bacteroidia bacterium]|nr:hypothetical protein [Bacteroidia bacterium]